jgi:hypothetical protein
MICLPGGRRDLVEELLRASNTTVPLIVEHGDDDTSRSAARLRVKILILT